MTANPLQGFGLYSALLAQNVGHLKGEILADELNRQNQLVDFQNMLNVNKLNEQKAQHDWQRQTDTRDFNYKLVADQFRQNKDIAQLELDQEKLDFSKAKAGIIPGADNNSAMASLANMLSPSKKFNETEELMNLKQNLEREKKNLHDFSKARNDLTASTGKFVEDSGFMADPATGKEVAVGERIKQITANINDLEGRIATKEQLLGGAPRDIEKHLKGLRPDKKGRTTITAPNGQKQKVNLKEYSAELRMREGVSRLLNNGGKGFNEYLESLSLPETDKKALAQKVMEAFLAINESEEL